MARNLTGLYDTKELQLGRGIGYLSVLDANDLPSKDQFDLGNIQAFTTSITTETLQHQSSRTGFKTTDIDVITSREQAIAFTLENQNHQNLAEWLMGTSLATQVNAAIAGFTEHAMVASVVLGRWYELRNSSGARAYDIAKANLVLEKSGAPDVLLVEGTDYEVDEEMGRVFLKSTAANIAATDTLDATLTADAGARTLHTVSSLTSTAKYVQVVFIRENPIDSSAREEWVYRKVQIAPTGDLGLISDEIGGMGFSGRLSSSNNAAHTASPYLLVTDLAPV